MTISLKEVFEKQRGWREGEKGLDVEPILGEDQGVPRREVSRDKPCLGVSREAGVRRDPNLSSHPLSPSSINVQISV